MLWLLWVQSVVHLVLISSNMNDTDAANIAVYVNSDAAPGLNSQISTSSFKKNLGRSS